MSAVDISQIDTTAPEQNASVAQTSTKAKPKRVKTAEDAAKNLCARSIKALNKSIKKMLRKKYEIHSAAEFAARFVSDTIQPVRLAMRTDIIELTNNNRPSPEKFKREDPNVLDAAHVLYCQAIDNMMPELGAIPTKVEAKKKLKAAKREKPPLETAMKDSSTKLPKPEKKKIAKPKADKPKTDKPKKAKAAK